MYTYYQLYQRKIRVMFNLIIDNPVIYYLTASVVAIVIGIVLGNILCKAYQKTKGMLSMQ
jgi:hypothetical protein